MTPRRPLHHRFHLLIWHRRNGASRPSSRAAAAAFFSVFLSALLLLPHCPGFRKAVFMAAALPVSKGNSSSENRSPETEKENVSDDAERSLPFTDFDFEGQVFSAETSETLPEADSTGSDADASSLPEENVEPEILPENEAVLVHKTYTASPSDVYVQVGNSFVKNVTDYGNDTVTAAESASPSFTLDKSGEIEVLIMHTHTTECYMPYEGDVYDRTCPTRSTDNEKNMAAVGEAILTELTAAGIGAVHDTTQHDYPSYNGSYDRSSETVKAYLEAYPSIKVVLDIHRDAIISGDTVTAPIVESDEGTAAQVMIISGCDDGTMDYPNWRENLAFAIDLQQQMEADHPGFTRPVLFDYRSYNQRLTTGSLLIEVGGHGNTLAQAILAGKWIGRSLAALAG